MNRATKRKTKIRKSRRHDIEVLQEENRDLRERLTEATHKLGLAQTETRVIAEALWPHLVKLVGEPHLVKLVGEEIRAHIDDISVHIS